MLLFVIYIAFISLGLPDSMLGSAWPSMHETLGVPESYAGFLTMLIYTGTIISSALSGWLINRLGTAKLVLLSTALTAVTMYGFSLSTNFAMLCCLALPYGLGGGSIDAALNNYVAANYKPMHMSFLHCFWGIGTVIGPFLMGHVIKQGGIWTQGYSTVATVQLVLTAILLLSISLWRRNKNVSNNEESDERGENSYKLLLYPGVRGAVLAFFLYCAIETSLGLWTVSFMIDAKGIGIVTATKCGMMFFVGITVGRILAGVLSKKYTDGQLILYGMVTASAGLLALALLFGDALFSYSMVVLTGIGCGPVFPCMIHRAPELVGKAHSQTLIGVQMAAASLGSITMPTLFGGIVHCFGTGILPYFSLSVMVLLAVSAGGKALLKQPSSHQ